MHKTRKEGCILERLTSEERGGLQEILEKVVLCEVLWTQSLTPKTHSHSLGGQMRGCREYGRMDGGDPWCPLPSCECHSVRQSCEADSFGVEVMKDPP